MITLKGDLLFNRELTANEIVAVRTLFENNKLDVSKPNNGITPFKFLPKFEGLEWDGSAAHEVENCLKVLVNTLTNGLQLNGVLVYENPDEFSYKIQVENNVTKLYKLDEEVTKPAELLRCPCCQKVSKKSDFKEVFNGGIGNELLGIQKVS